MTPESWLEIIQDAKKTAIIEDGKRKVHFLLKDGKEMVEEYNLDTNVVVRRAWREKSSIGQDIGWVVEIGEPEHRPNNIETYGIQENCNMPIMTRRITKRSLEWRIRNLPYPKDVYSVTVEKDGTITVRTSNKKYFKKITVPDLERIGLKLEQNRLSFTYQLRTLVVTYSKPPMLLNVEQKILNEVLKVKPQSSKMECPIS